MISIELVVVFGFFLSVTIGFVMYQFGKEKGKEEEKEYRRIHGRFG